MFSVMGARRPPKQMPINITEVDYGLIIQALMTIEKLSIRRQNDEMATGEQRLHAAKVANDLKTLRLKLAEGMYRR
jgi:hypothetical protein